MSESGFVCWKLEACMLEHGPGKFSRVFERSIREFLRDVLDCFGMENFGIVMQLGESEGNILGFIKSKMGT